MIRWRHTSTWLDIIACAYLLKTLVLSVGRRPWRMIFLVFSGTLKMRELEDLQKERRSEENVRGRQAKCERTHDRNVLEQDGLWDEQG